MSNFKNIFQAENAKWMLPVIVSLIAIIISIRSCQQTDTSLSLNKVEFESERVVVLQGKIINENTAIQLSAINENIILQRAKVIFPEKLNINTWIVYPPNPVISLELLRTRLQEIISQKMKKIEGAIIVNSFDSSPIVIETFYVAKGISYTDRSLYLIDYSFGINGDSPDPPFINFRGLVFKQRIHEDGDLTILLNNKFDGLIDQITKQK